MCHFSDHFADLVYYLPATIDQEALMSDVSLILEHTSPTSPKRGCMTKKDDVQFESVQFCVILISSSVVEEFSL